MEIRKVQKDIVWIVEGPYSAALHLDELAGLVHVSLPTVNRWLRAGRVPALVGARLRHSVLGLLDHPGWEQWVLSDGRLYAPNQHHFSPGELENVGVIYQTNRVLRRELAAFEASAAATEPRR